MLSTGMRDSRRRSRSHDEMPSAGSRYEVVNRIGEGTLFVVYRVRDRQDDQEFALKALKSVFSQHPQFGAGLLDAAEQALDMGHPRLINLVEAEEEEKTYYVVEELANGPSLESHLKRGPLFAREAHTCAVDITEALIGLHSHGLTHGDLRPRQLMLQNGHLKANDYYLDRAFAAASLTSSDVQPDAALYMAPERTDSAPATVASDLYSMGTILYRILAGRVPFDGSSPIAIAMRHRNDAPLRPSQFNPECPIYLEEITLRLMAKQPEERYPSAQAVLEALEEGLRANMRATSEPAATQSTSEIKPKRVSEPVREEPMDPRTFRRREARGALIALIWCLFCAGALVGIFYGTIYFWGKSTPPEVTVPVYVGQNEDDATRKLSEQGLKLTVGREAYDPRRPAGTIIAGDIPAGRRVRQGREVTVTVSRGEEPIKMYNFLELTLQRARQIIVVHGMRLGQVTEQYHDRIPIGYICGQYPEPNQPFHRSEPINLVVSKGPMPTADSTPEKADTSPTPAVDANSNDASAAPSDVAANNKVVLISRAVRIRVAIPNDATSTEVNIMVTDAKGEHSVFRKTQSPGDLIDQTVQVTRQQGTSATIRVYVGDTLLKEQRV